MRTKEQKLAILDKIAVMQKEGISAAEAAKKFGLSKDQIYGWRYDLKTKKKKSSTVTVTEVSPPKEKGFFVIYASKSQVLDILSELT